MADERLGGAYFEISGNASGAVQAANQANSSFADLERIVATNWWGVQNLGLAFAALPTAVAAGSAVAIKYAKEWEDALYDVSRTSELLGAALDEVEADLFRIARTTPIATTELAALASEGAALGIAAEDLGEFARVMGLTVASTDLTAEGVENVARVLNIMQVPAEEFEAFASSLIDVGRSTAATESDIITAAKRLATVGSVAGASQDQILAMSAALRSLGPEAEAGATAINKTLLDMGKAIASGSEEVVNYARIAGLSVNEFSEIFRTNGYDALQYYLNGLSQLPEDLVAVSEAFEQTGVDGSRQAAALATIVNGIRDAGNEQRDYNAILARTTQAREENTVLADLEAQKLNTLSGQMELLRNVTFEAGQAFGEMLLPSVKFAVSALSGLFTTIGDIARGFGALPPVFRGIVSTVTLATFGFLALVAAILTIGPRIVIAIGAMRQLRDAKLQAAQASEKLVAAEAAEAASTNAATAAVDRQRASYAAVTAEIDKLIFAETAETAATQAGTTADVQATGAIDRLRVAYAGLSTSTRRALTATLALTGAMIALTYWMQQQGKAAREADQARQSNINSLKLDLAQQIALRKEYGFSNDALAANARSVLRASDTYREMERSASELGVGMSTLNDIIEGRGSESDALAAIDRISESAKTGDESAKTLFKSLKDLYESYSSVRDATEDSVDALDDFVDSTGDAIEVTQEQADALDAVAKAHVDYIGAVFSLREAELSLRDAERDLQEERSKAANQSVAIQEAELELAKARQDHDSALSDLGKAERDLNSARQDGLDRLADAEDKLADSRDSYLDNLDKVKSLEQEIADLRAGPSTDQLISATNDLRNAQLRLLDANRKVSDAEWYLQYLREQGASNRDLEDAEFELAKARQDVADGQESVSESEKELADLRDRTSRQKEIIRLERDLASARRDNKSILRDIRGEEEDLADIRLKVANDGFYKDAQNDLVDAQLKVLDAMSDIKDAELELQNIRSGSLQDDALRAQLDYEQALYNVATAQTEAQRQQDAMNGLVWDSGDAARALASNLSALTQSVPDDDARRRLEGFVDILNRAPSVPTVSSSTGSTGTGDFGLDGLGDELSNAIGDSLTAEGLLGDSLGDANFWLLALPMLVASLAPLLIQGLIAMAGSAAVVAALSAALPFIIVGLLIVGIAAALIKDRNWAKVGRALWQGLQTAWDFVSDIGVWIWQNVLYPALSFMFPLFTQSGRDMIRGLWDGITGAIGDLFGNIGQKLYDWIVAPIKRFLGINSPSTVFSGIGGDIIRGLWNGIVNTFSSLFANFRPWEWITNFFTTAGSWLGRAGWDIIGGLWKGIVDFFNWIGQNFKPWDFITGFFSNTVDWLFSAGWNLIVGFWNGIIGVWDDLYDWFSRNIGGLLSSIGGWLGLGSPSKITQQYGEWLMEGMQIGIERAMGGVTEAAKAAADAADIGQYLKDNNLEYLLSADGFAGTGSAARFAANSAGGSTVYNYGDTVTIQAETNADPEEIVNEYVWQKRVRLRG